MSEQVNGEKATATQARNCQNCKHSIFIMGQPVRECRRFPPQVFPTAGPMGRVGFVSQFPMVKPDLLCGEFVSKLVS